MREELNNRESRLITIPEGLDQERIDAALSRVLGFSRSAIVSLIEEGAITRHGKPYTKSDRVSDGEVLEVLMPAIKGPPALEPTPIDGLIVVYDDEDVIVIDKPAGVAAHPSPGWKGPTVIGAIVAAGYDVATSGAAERQGVVHRLDVGTTGLMVVAKNEKSYSDLKQQFRDRVVTKVYHALVQGHMDPTEGTIDAPIDRHPREDYRFAVVADGKPSITHYTALEFFPSVSLLEIELETGRTHLWCRPHYCPTTGNHAPVAPCAQARIPTPLYWQRGFFLLRVPSGPDTHSRDFGRERTSQIIE